MHNDINVFCADKGWLFNDLKEKFHQKGLCSSLSADKNKMLWLCIRSSELKLSPDITKTVVQVHNMEPHDMHLFNSCLGVVFTHPMQEWLWKRSGFNGTYITIPIGARESIRPSASLPERPTVGFFCGENKLKWKGSDLFKKVIVAAKKKIDFDVLMIGRGLEHIADLGTYETRAAGIDDYARIDILFCASISPGIPLSVYEACAAGKIIVTTSRWFPNGKWASVRTGTSQGQLTSNIIKEINNREKNFSNREKYVCRPYLLENWIDKNIEFIYTIFNRKFNHSHRQSGRDRTLLMKFE